MHFRFPSWLTILSKPILSILISCLVLLVYMGFLLTTNYKNQVALHKSYLKTFKLDMAKRGASIGYFFSERKYDLRYITASRELSDYFMNKSFGMSESYGLKLSLFLITRLLKSTIINKSIHGSAIYERFVLIDNRGYCLVDTAKSCKYTGGHSFFHKEFLSHEQRSPEIIVEKIKGKFKIIVVAPCFYKGTLSGELVAILDLYSFVTNFIDFSRQFSAKGFGLVTRDGKYICNNSDENARDAYKFIFNSPDLTSLIKKISPGSLSVHEYPRILVAIQPVDNASLDLIGWIKKDIVFGSIAPWKLLASMGVIAFILLVTIGIIIRVNIQNLVLQTRFEESEKQHQLLEIRNRQLKNEISKRYKAEQELEEQRTLRIRSDRLRSLGEMAAGIAHELNQPLMGVKGMAELILLGMDEENVSIPQEKIRKNAKIIMDQADRMVHIINHVRLFAREAGNIEKSIENLNEVVNSGISLLHAQFKSHGVVLQVKLSSEPLLVFINPFSVEEVILNLLGNARDAVEERKNICGVSGYIPMVNIETRFINGSGQMACLEIKDNGIGISEDISNRIFDPFFTTKSPDKGTGLGLSITKSIVEEFNGEITLSSKEGEGSIFTINFPIYVTEKTYI